MLTKNFNVEALGNLLLGRARKIYSLEKGKVHISFKELSSIILAFLIESTEYTATEFVSE
jgi:hypothetical protein